MDTAKTEVVLGTRNHGKISEFRALLKGMSMRIFSFYDFPDLPPVEASGKSFQENAEKKAKAIAKGTGRLAIAEDSGLEVRFLDGRPGVLSSCFAGEGATDRDNARRVLKLLDSVAWEERDARYVSVVCVATPKGQSACAAGVCEGAISFEMRGTHGVAYDSIFVPKGFSLTMAELSPEDKNGISHGTVAMNAFRDVLEQFVREKKTGK